MSITYPWAFFLCRPFALVCWRFFFISFRIPFFLFCFSFGASFAPPVCCSFSHMDMAHIASHCWFSLCSNKAKWNLLFRTTATNKIVVVDRAIHSMRGCRWHYACSGRCLPVILCVLHSSCPRTPCIHSQAKIEGKNIWMRGLEKSLLKNSFSLCMCVFSETFRLNATHNTRCARESMALLPHEVPFSTAFAALECSIILQVIISRMH